MVFKNPGCLNRSSLGVIDIVSQNRLKAIKNHEIWLNLKKNASSVTGVISGGVAWSKSFGEPYPNNLKTVLWLKSYSISLTQSVLKPRRMDLEKNSLGHLQIYHFLSQCWKSKLLKMQKITSKFYKTAYQALEYP